MNVTASMLDSILVSYEEQSKSCVESDLVEEMIKNIQSIKLNIERNKDMLKS